MNTATKITDELMLLQNAQKAKTLMRFFKTGPGEYAEGDLFLGIQVPHTRAVVKKYAHQATLNDSVLLTKNKYHEVRLAGLLLMVELQAKSKYSNQDIASHYLSNIKGINNWDLVDLSAPKIIGPYVCDVLSHEKRMRFLQDALKSRNIWLTRIAVLATYHQILQGEAKLTFYVAQSLLFHKHDLIHKAVGWMLREVGKRINEDTLIQFLSLHYKQMPRTMLRYALEHLPSDQKNYSWLKTNSSTTL